MCGISVTVIRHNPETCLCNASFNNKIQLDLLKNRGPDGFQSHSVAFNNIQIIANGTVLHQRGQPIDITLQPAVSVENNFLLWNGEVFNGETLGIKQNENDTLFLLEKFSTFTSVDIFLDTLSQINGPWAFIFWHNQTQKLFFGRDVFGRRSLLVTKEIQNIENECITLSLASVAINDRNWEEVSALGVYCLNLKEDFTSFPPVQCFYWSSTPSGSENDENVNLKLFSPIKNPLCVDTPPHKIKAQPVNEYIMNLYELKEFKIMDAIDNCFNTKLDEHLESFSRVLEILGKADIFVNLIEQFINVLGQSVEKRVANQPFLCKDCIVNSLTKCNHSSLAILFSGGIDSMIIAYLADKYYPSDLPIDLLNVSFEHTLKNQTNVKAKRTKEIPIEKTFLSPDRATGKKGYEELCRTCTQRCWKFVEIDVTISKLQENRDSKIKFLIKPSDTVLDDSIGCALWFASKGDGFISNSMCEMVSYCSPARVVLAGMGADEQLSGYSRHRQKYITGGWENLLGEIRLEIDRISKRNLGRDDRIISDHGREARFPFLDEDVVNFLNKIPLHLKANLELPRGLGDKLLLRMTVHSLNLRNASVLPKRAIQFGSRIAFSEGKEKGSDTCNRLNLK